MNQPYETIILIIWYNEEFFPDVEEYNKGQGSQLKERMEQLKGTHRATGTSDRLFTNRKNTVAIEYVQKDVSLHEYIIENNGALLKNI